MSDPPQARLLHGAIVDDMLTSANLPLMPEAIAAWGVQLRQRYHGRLVAVALAQKRATRGRSTLDGLSWVEDQFLFIPRPI